MRLNANDMVSKATIGSSRNLIFVSASIFATYHYNFPTADWSVFGRTIKANQFNEITLVVLIFLGLNHLVHWSSDYIAYTKWFKDNDVGKRDVFSIGAFVDSESIIDGLQSWLKSLGESTSTAKDRILDIESIDAAVIQSIQGDRDVAIDLNVLRETTKANGEALNSISSSVNELSSMLNSLGPNFSKIKWTSRFVIWGWYFAVPACAFLTAIYSSTCR